MSEEIDWEKSSPWLRDFHVALQRGRGVLLHGNTRDAILFQGEFRESLIDVLRLYFRIMTAEIVGNFDLVQGLEFGGADVRGTRYMQERFDSIVAKDYGGAVEPDRGTPTESSASARTEGKGQSSARRRPIAATTEHSGIGKSITGFSSATAAFQIVMADNSARSALILDGADFIVSNPERPGDEEERRSLLRIEKALSGAASWPGSGGRRNALVMISRQLSSVPAWLYRDNPHLALVQVPLPSHKERRHFLDCFLHEFNGGNLLNEETHGLRVNDLADLTDGLRIWDLYSLQKASMAESLPVTQGHELRQLMDRFRYGRRHDPWSDLDEKKIQEAAAAIKQRVIGQDTVTDAVTDVLYTAKIGITLGRNLRSSRPRGVFFFVGPSGVGKTELAKALAEQIFGDESAYARFDMSEYQQEHAAERLAGAPPGFVGFEQGGQLTERVRSQPFSVILFDEIDKAHPKVLDKFLQVLEDGRLTDGKGQTSYFGDTILIFTSNIGASSLPVTHSPELLNYHAVREHFKVAVENKFVLELGRTELLGRFGQFDKNILVFDILRQKHVAGIAEKFLRELQRSAQERRQLHLDYGNSNIIEYVQERMKEPDQQTKGGRAIKTLLEALVETPLNRWVFQNKPGREATLQLKMNDKGVILVTLRESKT